MSRLHFDPVTQINITMAESYNTQGVPEPEVSARSMREMTSAFSDDQSAPQPVVYEQVIPAKGQISQPNVGND